MDIEKLIERFEYDAKDWAGDPHIKRDLLDAATALSTLQAENEKLRAEVESLKKGYCAGCSIPAVKAEQIRDLTDAPKLRAELEQVKMECDAAKSTLAERIGVRGAEPITTAFGLPIDRLRGLAKADREGRCVVLNDLTVADLQQMLTVLDCTHYGDGAETYATGYRNGHRNGRIEILRYVLEINEGDSVEAEAALKERKVET